MKEYETITALKAEFVSGDFQLDEEVSVGGIVYENLQHATEETMQNMICENAKGVVVYSGSKENNWLMFLWGAHKNAVIPYDVRTTTQQQITEKEDLESRIIADKIEVHFLNMPVSSSLVAKVDTGAEMCSLNAQNIQVDRQNKTVSFVAPQLSNNTIKMNLADQQAVKTSGGDTTYRAVISATLKINGKVLKDIQINLNDRSDMQDPMLIGQNALQPGNFLIDPNIIKEADQLLTKEFLNILRGDLVVPSTTLTEETAQQLYEALTQVGDISIGDMMKLLRTQVLKNIDDISY